MAEKGLPVPTLKWREGEKAPFKTFRLFDSVVDGDTLYVQETDTVKIHSYSARNGWVSLPDSPYGGSGLTVIDHLPTVVGGYGGSEHINKLFSLRKGMWTEEYPPMQTKRREMTVLSTRRFLIVAGGITTMSIMLTAVEVMNIESRRWFTAASLPDPVMNSSITICGDQIYMLGGQDKNWRETSSVFTCSLRALLRSCCPCPLLQSCCSPSPQGSLSFLLQCCSACSIVQSCCLPSDKPNVWRRVADCPAKTSTCVSLCGHMLAIGGRDYENKLATTAVFMYAPTTNSWSVVSHMLSARIACLAAVLPRNQLMVVAGLDGNYKLIDTVESASVDQ